MKTNYMSLIKTNELTSLLLAITVIFIFSLSPIFLSFSHIQGLSIEQKIEDATKALTIIALFFGALAVSINAYYTSKLSLGMDQDALAKRLLEIMAGDKNIAVSSKYTEQKPEELIWERFSKAIEHLGHEKIETRFAAIYALEKIAQDSPKDHWTIMEILTAFIRENAPIIPADEEELPELSKIPTDIQTALTVIARRDARQDPVNQKLDLRDIDITNADLMEANLSGVILTGANLQWVNFIGANLSQANLTEANLSGAIFYEANLQQANLCEANLQTAVLRKANLTRAMLYEANLEGAILYDANLQEAILYNANLEETILCDANLQGANLEGSNIPGANLIGSNLRGAKLIGANLEGILLSTANLEHANLYEANLQEANLYEANLQQANLSGTNLEGVIFQKANLCGANLSRSENVEAEQLELATGDRTTILPEYLEIPQHWQQLQADFSASEAEI